MPKISLEEWRIIIRNSEIPRQLEFISGVPTKNEAKGQSVISPEFLLLAPGDVG